jgi:hypothetical protein
VFLVPYIDAEEVHDVRDADQHHRQHYYCEERLQWVVVHAPHTHKQQHMHIQSPLARKEETSK